MVQNRWIELNRSPSFCYLCNHNFVLCSYRVIMLLLSIHVCFYFILVIFLYYLDKYVAITCKPANVLKLYYIITARLSIHLLVLTIDLLDTRSFDIQQDKLKYLKSRVYPPRPPVVYKILYAVAVPAHWPLNINQGWHVEIKLLGSMVEELLGY